MPLGLGGAGALITYSVQVSCTPPFATPRWVDITARVKTMNIVGPGRQHELQRVVPTTATILLDNLDAVFNTWNTAGPFAPGSFLGGANGLTPQMPLRVVVTTGGIDYDIAYLYVDSWIPEIGRAHV